jgi:hypothetical protein
MNTMTRGRDKAIEAISTKAKLPGKKGKNYWIYQSGGVPALLAASDTAEGRKGGARRRLRRERLGGGRRWREEGEWRLELISEQQVNAASGIRT